MKRNIFFQLGLVIAVFFASFATNVSPAYALPGISFLGTGGDYGSGLYIVKRRNPFRFEEVQGPFSATHKERVWATDGNGFVAHYKDNIHFGKVEEGELIEYVVIDDDVDDRINTWSIDGVEVHTSPQGMVVYDSFTAPSSGELKLYAADSIGASIEIGGSPTGGGRKPEAKRPFVPYPFECHGIELESEVDGDENGMSVETYIPLEDDLVDPITVTEYLVEKVFEGPIEVASAFFSPDGCRVGTSVRRLGSDDPWQIFQVPARDSNSNWYRETGSADTSRILLGWSTDWWELVHIEIDPQTGESSVVALDQWANGRRDLNVSALAGVVHPNNNLFAFENSVGEIEFSSIKSPWQRTVNTGLTGRPVAFDAIGVILYFTQNGMLMWLNVVTGEMGEAAEGVTDLAFDEDGSGRGVVTNGERFYLNSVSTQLTQLPTATAESATGESVDKPDWFDPKPIEPVSLTLTDIQRTFTTSAEAVEEQTLYIASLDGSREAFVRDGYLWIRWTLERSDGLPQEWNTGIAADEVIEWDADWVITVIQDGQSYETDQFASFLRLVESGT